VTVLDPDVNVGPLTVTLYPEPAFVEAAICEVAVAVSVGENNWLKLTVPEVAVLQSGTPLVVKIWAPTQNTRDSGIIPLSTTWVAVLAATLPVSVEAPDVSIEAKVVIRT
jgi:hypothetical protein